MFLLDVDTDGDSHSILVFLSKSDCSLTTLGRGLKPDGFLSIIFVASYSTTFRGWNTVEKEVGVDSLVLLSLRNLPALVLHGEFP